MQYSFSDEQEQFRDIVSRFMREKSPSSEVRRWMETADGYDLKVWQQMNRELGLSALAIPEAYGGQGFGFVELGIVLEEMGRYLVCTPFLSSAVLAGHAILNAGSESQKLALLPRITSGEVIATLAVSEAQGSWQADDIEMLATETQTGFSLTGMKKFVSDGMSADLIVIAALVKNDSGKTRPAFFTIKNTADGFTRRAVESMDKSRKLAVLELKEVDAELLGDPFSEEGSQAVSRTICQGAVALANEMVGGCQYLLESAVEYAQLRMQFGRSIGSFQAVKHMCADMLLEVELAKSAAYQAAQAASENDPEFPAIASLAKACVSETYIRTAATCIQIHGGIGFTWDNDTHLWFKRAKSSEEFLGGPTKHRELLMQCWGV